MMFDNNKSEEWKDGYRMACADIKDLLSALHQRTQEDSTHRMIDETWGKIRILEVSKAPRISIETENAISLPSPDLPND
jgi:hypothetical protein